MLSQCLDARGPAPRSVSKAKRLIPHALAFSLLVCYRLRSNSTTSLFLLVAPYVDNIFAKGVTYDSEIRSRNYDLLIVTPGPTVNELGHCINAVKAPEGIIIPANE